MLSSRCYSVLVDGGYLKRELGTASAPATYAAIDGFLSRLVEVPKLSELTLHRIYYYDAAPNREKKAKPLQGGEIDFGSSEVASRNQEILEGLKRRAFVAVRLGELAFSGWHVRPNTLRSAAAGALQITSADIDPTFQQKGVDMRIGLDIAALSLKRLVQVVVLVTGDTDFIPAMKFARREGLQLFVVQVGRALHDGLHEHSDYVLTMPRKEPAAKKPAAAKAAARI